MEKLEHTISPQRENNILEMLIQRQYEQEDNLSPLLERYKELLRTISKLDNEIDNENLENA
jgi:guanylate kinase